MWISAHTVPPSPPEAVIVNDLGPFSATVSWQPPLEDGGAVGPLMYTVTLTNTTDSTTFKFNPTAAITMNLANLRHSVTYRVQVVAGNEAGMGPPAEMMFRTNDTGEDIYIYVCTLYCSISSQFTCAGIHVFEYIHVQ